jgi:diguanylate cyclase (GGDEF)-like protein/PAS domain S-box-containing protein
MGMNTRPPGKDKEFSTSSSPEEILLTEREDFVRQVSFMTAIAAVVAAALNIPSMSLMFYFFLALASILFWINRSDISLNRKSVIMVAGFYFIAIAHFFFYGLSSSAAVYLILVSVLSVILFTTYFGLGMIAFSLLTWLGVGFFFSSSKFIPFEPYNANNMINWLTDAANIALVIMALIQSRLTTYEILRYATNIANEKRDLQNIRSELLLQKKSLDYEQYLLHVLMDNVSDRIFFKDTNGHYTRVSKALARQFGVSPEEVISKSDADFFSPEYAEAIKDSEEDMLKTKQAIIDKVEREIWRDGRPNTWSITNRILLRDPEGRFLGWFGTSRNITEIKKAQETAQRYAHQLATISEVGRSVTSSFILSELMDNLVNLLRKSFSYYAVNVWLKNEAGDTLTLENSSGMSGQNMDGQEYLLPLEKRSIITNVCKTGRYRLVYDVINDAPDYAPMDIFPNTRSKIVLPLRKGDKIFGVLDIHSDKLDTFVYNDVMLLQTLADQAAVSIENANLYSKVEYLATNDALSGLYNRRYLFELSRIEVERSSRYGCPLSAVILDIDHFKKVNDTYGHNVGDQVIQGLGAVIRKNLRNVDITGRYGGEEFVFLLPETELPQAEHVANRLRQAIASTVFDTTRGPVSITISLGVAKLEDENPELGYMLDCADKAMYRAKLTGRNKVVLYSKEEFTTESTGTIK